MRLKTNPNPDQRSVYLSDTQLIPLDIYFYDPTENKVFVSRNGVFLEKELINKGVSASHIDFEEIQDVTDMETDIGTGSL